MPVNQSFLSSLKFITPSELNFTIEKPKFGWLYFSLFSKNKKLRYQLSYICEPWEELIGTFISLCMGSSLDYIQNSQIKFNYITGYHDLEGEEINFWYWFSDTDLVLFVLKDFFDTDTVSALLSTKFVEEVFEKETFVDFPLISSDIIFAIKGSKQEFASLYLHLLKQIKNLRRKAKIPPNKNIWPYYYPKVYEEKLLKIKNDN